MPAGLRWACESGAGEPAVVYPLGDLYEHQLLNERCPCNPWLDEGILVHEAFDGRTAFETGERKAS
jgi:hypothetical protein